MNGVPLSAGINDRALYGYSIHNDLNTLINERPKLQILAPNGPFGCPELLRTIPLMRTGNPPQKIADGDDHWVVALAYFCTGMAEPSHESSATTIPRWMQPKKRQLAWQP